MVADEACAPELEPRRFAALAFNDAAFVNGWLKQQVGCSRPRRLHRCMGCGGCVATAEAPGSCWLSARPVLSMWLISCNASDFLLPLR